MAYAEDTRVPISRSRDELERILTRFGADQVATLANSDGWTIAFAARGLRIQLHIAMPENGPNSQEARRLWRTLVLVTKARLVAIDDGLESLADAFLAQVMLPSGYSVAEQVAPQLAAAAGGQLAGPITLALGR